MILKKLKIQNFRSFGNNINEIVFDEDKGNLILLVGGNAQGKSSIRNSIDFSLYGEVFNNNKKIKLSSLPNRLNNNLMVELEFLSKDDKINVIRKINPTDFKILINDVNIEIEGKGNLQEKLNKYIEFDSDSWKSFISMSINDFKNFTLLKPEEKRMLLDRLFNLEIIDSITIILKEKKKQFNHFKDLLQTEINSYENSLNDFTKSLKKIKETDEIKLSLEKNNLKELMLSKKDEYTTLNNKLSICESKNDELRTRIKTTNNSLIEIKYQITDINNKIQLFNKGICPTCSSDLTSDNYDEHKHELTFKLNNLNVLNKQLNEEYLDLTNKQKKLTQITSETILAFSELKVILNSTKQRLSELNIDNNIHLNESIEDIENTISNIKSKKDIISKKLGNTVKEANTYDDILKIFSDDKIKKQIISKIIVPINKFIKENLKLLDTNFNIELDNNFNAIITNLGEEIETETLSTGESKKVNIAIMLAYLKLIRSKKYINILFLDEVFSSVDVDSIYLILKILKDFAYEYKINIFLIHHAMLDNTYFDKVLYVEKNITSNIRYD